jgi:sulfonate transport system substrate-binding protein
LSRPRTRPILAALLLLFALVAAACGEDKAVGNGQPAIDEEEVLEIPEGVKLVIGDQGGAVETPLRLAGELDDLPYEVEFASFASGPLVNEAMGAGEIDLGMMGDTPALLSFASGLDTVVAGVKVTEGSGAYIVAGDDSGIDSLEDLKGKRIAYTSGTNTHGFVLRALDTVGLKEDDIEQVDVPLTDLANVLGSGQADAAVVYEIFRPAYFEEHPDAEILIETNDVVPSYLFLLAPRSSAEDRGKQAALEDFVGRIARAAEYVKANPDEWIQAFYVETQKQTPEAGRAAYEAQGPAEWVEVGGDAQKDQQDQADLFHENGRFPEEVDVTEQFDPRYAKRFTTAIEKATEAPE